MSWEKGQSGALAWLADLKRRYWGLVRPQIESAKLTIDEAVRCFPDFIAGTLGIRVVSQTGPIDHPAGDPFEFDSSNTMGLFDDRGAQPTIIVTGKNEESRRFTIAHELAHKLRQDTGLQTRIAKTTEREVEALGAEILMPTVHVRNVFSETFGEPIEVSAEDFRLKQLFSCAGKIVPQKLPPRELLMRASLLAADAIWFGGTRYFISARERFKVSLAAMARRFRELGLIRLPANSESLGIEIPTLFISYNHDDVEHARKLQRHLAPLAHNAHLRIVSDMNLKASQSWQFELDKMVESASIGVCLLSDAYFDSEACRREYTRLLQRRSAEQAHVVGVLLSDCMWDVTPFKDIQILPQDESNDLLQIVEWPNREAAWHSVAKAIHRLLRA